MFSRNAFLLASAAVALGGCTALYAATAGASLNSQDKSFVDEAAKAGMSEVHMGKLGMEKASAPDVRAFSQRMINDHTKANDELTGIATRKGLSMPGDHNMPGMLNVKSGASFDHAFAKQAVEDHEKAVALFEKEAAEGSDPDLKAFARRTLPTLRSHLAAARALPQQ
ncbi:MAG TPA: DUF4142 domain-containing protein [Bryobacteraceae bacterium]|jgi:putative membrane protein